jgi:hypothetical protein
MKRAVLIQGESGASKALDLRASGGRAVEAACGSKHVRAETA